MEEYLCDSCDSYRACKSGLRGRDKDCASYKQIGEEWFAEADRQRVEEEVRRDKSMKWTTFQGRKVSLGTIDQQHLSNCYWFGRIIHGLKKDDEHLKLIVKELAIRFNGQLLPYRPHVEFEQEIAYLESIGCLRSRVNLNFASSSEWYGHVTDIVFEGEVVGEIIKPL